MAFFIPRDRWRRQPNRPVRIDQSHPLASSLRFFIVFINGVGIDLQSWTVGNRNGSAAVQGGGIPVGGGTVAKLASASSDFYSFPHRNEWELIDAITLAWAGRINSAASHHFAGKHTGNGGADNPFDFRTNGSGAPTLVRGKNGAGLCIHEGATALTANVRQTVEITQGPLLNATSVMYGNGTSMSVTVTVAGPASNAATSGQPIRVGRRDDGLVQMDGLTEYVAGFATNLGANALREFRLAPYALLLPRETPVFYSLGGGGTTDGVGASAGTATASATSQTIAASVGASAASAGASSQSQAVWQGVGSSTAAGAAQAVGTDGAAGVTAADGVATATSTAAGAGQAVWGALGAAYGFIAPVGVSQTIEYRAATSAGSATASADGTEASAYEPRAATAAATSLAAATSHVVVAAIGAIVSTAVAAAVSDAASTVQAVVGVAAAVAVATGVAQAVWAAVGASTGSGVADGRTPQTLTASEIAAQIIVQTFTPETYVQVFTPEVYVRDGPTTIRITL